MHQLFDANFKKCAQVANKTPTFYQKNNRLLISAVAAKASSEVGAEPSLQEALTGALENKPKEIIVPVIEEKSGVFAALSERRHIKTLHIKDIEYDTSGNVSSYSVDYYDSKPAANNSVFPSDAIKGIVASAVKCSCDENNWKPMNPKDNQPQQPSRNSSDCGYWAYVWSSALFNRTEGFDITDYYPSENEMKLIHIARLIAVLNDPNSGPKKDFIGKAKELFELIMQKPDSDPKKAAAINVLYGEMKQVNKKSGNSYQVTDEDDFAVVGTDKDATASIYNTELIENTINGLSPKLILKN